MVGLPSDLPQLLAHPLRPHSLVIAKIRTQLTTLRLLPPFSRHPRHGSPHHLGTLAQSLRTAHRKIRRQNVSPKGTALPRGNHGTPRDSFTVRSSVESSLYYFLRIGRHRQLRRLARLHLRTPTSTQILSKHFEKGLAFSLWTGSSQFGDFIALVVSYLLVEEGKLNPGFFLIAIAILLVGIYYLNKQKMP